MNEKSSKIINNPNFLKSVVILILLNSIVLGAKTYDGLMADYGNILSFLDNAITVIFIFEICLYLIIRGMKDCFTDPWFLFDFFIVSLAAIDIFTKAISFFIELGYTPDLSHFAALRAVRVLRILRLITIFPNLRKVILGLLNAIPGIASIGTILIIILYTSALIATQLYSKDFPEFFGNIQLSLFSLFQILTFEGWPDIARSVMTIYPNSWIFFVLYILVTSFIIINLFVAVIVDSVQQEDSHDAEKVTIENFRRLEEKIDLLRDELNNKNK